MKRYEGLFILNTAGKEESIKDIIDKVSADLTALGCKLETVQKMEKRAFSRVAEKKHASGYYVNYIFEAEGAVLVKLQKHFALNEDVFRILFTESPVIEAKAA